jgi:hypothetical protein
MPSRGSAWSGPPTRPWLFNLGNRLFTSDLVPRGILDNTQLSMQSIEQWGAGQFDYEDEDTDDEEETGPTGRMRKKPWRYRWPDEFRDEILARLLDLNQKRAELERLSGAAAEAGGGKSRKKSAGAKKAAKKNADHPELFGG